MNTTASVVAPFESNTADLLLNLMGKLSGTDDSVWPTAAKNFAICLQEVHPLPHAVFIGWFAQPAVNLIDFVIDSPEHEKDLVDRLGHHNYSLLDLHECGPAPDDKRRQLD